MGEAPYNTTVLCLLPRQQETVNSKKPTCIQNVTACGFNCDVVDRPDTVMTDDL